MTANPATPRMNADELTQALKDEARRLGFDLAGATAADAAVGDFDRLERWLADGFAGEMAYFADRIEAYRRPSLVLADARSALVLLTNYRTAEPAATGPRQGRVSRYAWGDDYHEVLRGRLHALADFHRRLAPTAAVRGVVDTAPVLERRLAWAAGLGWIGKNAMLIHPRFGSWCFLAVLLTSETLAYDKPMDFDGCGECRACLDACPTGALKEPRRVDARRCASYLTVERRGDVPRGLVASCGQRLFGCDACQEACPWNRETPVAAEPAFEPRPGMNPVDLPELLALDQAAFRGRFRGSPLGRAKLAGMRKNAERCLAHAAQNGMP